MYYFIYETINNINGKLYRGAHSTPNLNDGYLGSGVDLKKDLILYGVESFDRKILCFCDDLEDMSNKESFYVDREWVDSDNTYNLQTGGLSRGTLSYESKLKISKTLKEKYKSGEIIPTKPNLGKVAWNKGKTGIYSEETKKKISDTLKGNIPWNKGKKYTQIPWNKGKIGVIKQSEETKKKISDTLKEKYKKENHPNKGKVAWNKGMSTLNGTPQLNIMLKNSHGVKITCPHCGKIGSKPNMVRWHFDNCKKRG